ncbi:MAG: TIGR02556 family CRISPR-associated protein [Candidatus Cloacimonetes bacterium]|nr:TIGR02556 family CRISPR-associated protein [Candidatus Cloacimonadota bacterium]
MIHKLAALRKYIPDDSIEENDYGLYMDERKEKVLVLNFDYAENNFTFQDISLEDYSKSKNLSCFYYKQSSANTVSDFPTLMLNSKDIDSAFKKVFRILKNCLKHNNQIQNLIDCINDTYNDLIVKIQEIITNNTLYIMTFKINNQYVGQSQLFEKTRQIASDEVYSSYYTNKKPIIAKDKFCSVCMQKNKEVWGYVSTFNFYAVKTEYPPIAGGMDKDKTWKNYPVCEECAKDLKSAKDILVKKMRFSLCGLSYYIIPSFISDSIDNEINKEIMDIFLIDNYDGRFRLDKKSVNKITSSEREIFDALAEAPNQLTYTLFFFEENNSEFKILLSIDDIFPSHLKKIFACKKEVERFRCFKDLKSIYKKDEIADLEFNFDILKAFFPIKSKILGDYTKSFLEITRAIFMQKQLSKDFILKQIMYILSSKFAREELYPYDCLKSFMLLLFLSRLGLLQNKPNKDKEIQVDKMYEDFFSEHEDFFNSNIKKAIFLEGALCQKLLYIQWHERGATPFRSHLNSMKLNPKLIKKLLPEIIEKLNQYDKNYYRKLEEAISELFINSTFDISNDEISYYFMLGMNLSDKFKTEEEKKNENQ